MLRLLLVFMISFCFSSLAEAQTIILQSGEKIAGQIIEQTELRITVDVQGLPQTYYLGEIASIDGKKVEMPRQKAVENALVEVKKVPVPYYHDEQDSLIRFMNARSGNAPGAVMPASPAVISSPVAAPAQVAVLPKAASLPQEQPSTPPAALPQVVAISGNTNKAVIAAPDGGIIVVSAGTLTKYDKDFKVVKQIKLTADNT